jgi:uncharacterized protein YkwD
MTSSTPPRRTLAAALGTLSLLGLSVVLLAGTCQGGDDDVPGGTDYPGLCDNGCGPGSDPTNPGGDIDIVDPDLEGGAQEGDDSEGAAQEGDDGEGEGGEGDRPLFHSQWEDEVIAEINLLRSVGGPCGPPVGPLAKNAELSRAALDHAIDMATAGYFSHYDQEGYSPHVRMVRAGFTGRTGGENLAASWPGPVEVVAAWRDSPGHCRVMLDRNANQIGVGYTEGGGHFSNVWVVNTGACGVYRDDCQ